MHKIFWSLGSLALMLALVIAGTVRAEHVGSADLILTKFPLPTTENSPEGIMAGPDGNLWFTEARSSKIGRITPQGAITEFPLPTPRSGANAITAGADGNLWFTELFASKIGRITPLGEIAEFPVPFTSEDAQERNSSWPYDITSGADGNLWFTQHYDHQIGRITPAGTITEFNLPADWLPKRITLGADGNLWFIVEKTDWSANSTIGRITPDGTVTEFTDPGFFICMTSWVDRTATCGSPTTLPITSFG